MRKWIAIAFAAASLVAGRASAEDAQRGRAEWYGFPGGGLLFTDASDSTGPASFTIGTAFALRVNGRAAVEVDAVLGLGRRQTIEFGGRTFAAQPMPDTIGLGASVIVDAVPRSRGVVPYLASGIGALLVVPRDGTGAVGFTSRSSLPTANLGGGLKWYAPWGWGLRADYRVLVVGHDDRTAAFYGDRARVGQRFSIGGFTVF